MRAPRTAAALLLAVTAAPVAATAQDDLRDRVTLADGKVVRGRVAERFGPELLVMQGGRRVRVPQARVVTIDTVRDRVADVLRRRAHGPRVAAWRWFLVEQAAAQELPALARLLALDLVLDDDGHAAAHEFLGHRREANGEWRWPLRDRFVTRDALEKHHADFGRALELHGEHFVVRSDAGLRRTVDALLDLERLYVWWQEELGATLRLREALTPVSVALWREPADFPAVGAALLPYFQPGDQRAGTGGVARSWYPVGGARAEGLFEVAAQALLYATLAPSDKLPNREARLCAWAEVGLGQWVQSRFRGEPGRAEPGAPELPRAQAQLAARERPFGLETLTHRPALAYYGGSDRGRAALELALAHAFVAFLMAEHEAPLTTRDRFLAYLQQALREGKGDSSTALDEALGRRVESLEEPWRAWLERQLLTPR